MVDVLMPKRDLQQCFWKSYLRECPDSAYLAVFPPEQRIKRVNRFAPDLGRQWWLRLRLT
jgi:hypothetical protein